ncbi:MAG: hypothetical protein RIR07_1028, partial [Bacteroidota bacterium]
MLKNSATFVGMLATLLALQMMCSDSVILGTGAELDRAVQRGITAQQSAAKSNVNQGAERYSVQVYAGRRADANAMFARLTDSVGAQVPVV